MTPDRNIDLHPLVGLHVVQEKISALRVHVLSYVLDFGENEGRPTLVQQ